MRFQYSRAWLPAAGGPERIAAGASDSTRRPDALRCQPAAVPVPVSILSQAISARAQAQTTPVAGQRIQCIKQADSTDDFAISTPGITVEKTEDQEHGITGQHSGAGIARIESRPDTITAGGRLSQGIPSSHKCNSAGDVFLRLLSMKIRTNKSGAASSAVGIFGETAASSRLDAVVRGGCNTARGDSSHGIFPQHNHLGSGPAGSLTPDVGVGIATETSGGNDAQGIFVQRLNGASDVLLDLRSLFITAGDDSAGGILASHGSEGNNDITVADGGVTTRGVGGYGINTSRNANSSGDVLIDTESTEVDATSQATGSCRIIAAHHIRANIATDLWGGSIETRGVQSHGIHAHDLQVENCGTSAGTIVNADSDGGETVLAINGTPLYDSKQGGRTDLWAPNGARDVTMVEGFTGLDFSSTESFIGCDAARAAVHEALPGALLHVDDDSGNHTGRLRRADCRGGLAWRGGGGVYAGGRLALTRYSADRSSSIGGGRKTGATGLARTARQKGCRRFAPDGGTILTARTWLDVSGLSLGRFPPFLKNRQSERTANEKAACGNDRPYPCLRAGRRRDHHLRRCQVRYRVQLRAHGRKRKSCQQVEANAHA